MRLATRFLPVACLAAIALAGCGRGTEGVGVKDAYVRLPAVAGNPGAAYFTVRGGKTPDRLVSVSSDMAARVELHASRMQAGVMTMAPLDGIDVPADGSVALAPGGAHVMLFGLPATLKKGAEIPFTLRFKSGAVVGLAATAIGPGDKAPN
jgi:copper(I)-binding protein